MRWSGPLSSILVYLSILCAHAAKTKPPMQKGMFGKFWIPPKQIRDVRVELQPGSVFVPVIGRDTRRYGAEFKTFGDKRYSMFCDGVYPGVEFVLLSSVSSSDGDETLTIKPAYDLIPQLERDWPVEVKLSTIPFVLTRGMYNTITILGSASLAFTLFLVAAVLAQTFTFSVVNSRSMMPTIMPRDVILVDKVSPQLKKVMRMTPKKDDVVFFREPEALKRYAEKNKLPPVSPNDLFVKRVSKVTDSKDGDSCVYVLGDNPRYSLDSRDFGCFPAGDLVGAPVARVFPIARIGLLGGPPAAPAKQSTEVK